MKKTFKKILLKEFMGYKPVLYHRLNGDWYVTTEGKQPYHDEFELTTHCCKTAEEALNQWDYIVEAFNIGKKILEERNTIK